jgi:hypothetical protein
MASHKHVDVTKKAPNGGLMLNGVPPWLSVISEYNGELFDFMSRRFAKDAQVLRELHERRTLSDFSELQANWLQEALKDYSAEATKLMGITMKQPADAAHESQAR